MLRLLSTGGVFSSNFPLKDTLSLFLLQAAVIIAFCRSLSLVGVYLKQPRVIFEIIGGILLGPSAIGRDVSYITLLFPSQSLPYLGLVANIGLVLYLFLVGLELDPKLLLSHAKKAGGIALMGIAVPFALGVSISQTMFDILQPEEQYRNVSSLSFFVFIGTAMSITAFPVLARILKEGGLIYTPPGAMAMGAAALNDAIAWCLLVLAISIANSSNMPIAGYVFSCIAGFALILFMVVRPVFECIVTYVERQNNDAMDSNLFAFTLCLVFVFAFTTAVLGVDAIFGSFIFGLIIPRNSRLFHTCEEKMEELVVSFTLPLYFTLSGLKTDVTTIRTKEEAAITVLVCAVASIGKFVGCGGTAVLSGMNYRESAVVALLMNTRGLVELIVLNLGLEAGILSVKTFSVMVIMCLFTTFLTCPLIELVYPPRLRTRNDDEIKPQMADINFKEEIVKSEAVEGYSNDMRLSIVVDSGEQLQGLLNLLSVFLPHKSESELAVTALRFIEPTLTVRDKFLPLNHEGRLLHVAEESASGADSRSDLLPLSMFCRAMGVSVNGFCIQGNPDEFPRELNKLSSANDAHFVAFPWRQNDYSQRFLRQSLRVLSVPLLLMVHFGENNEIADQGNAPIFPIFSRTFDDFDAMQSHSHGLKIANRSMNNSRFNRRSKQRNEVERFSSCNVVAVVLGASTDSLMIRLLLRIATSGSRSIHVLLPGDFITFSAVVVHAVEAFRESTCHLPNVQVTQLKGFGHAETDRILDFCSTLACDVFLCSYLQLPDVVTTSIWSSHSVDMDVESGEQRLSGHQSLDLRTNSAIRTSEVEQNNSKVSSSKLQGGELGALGSAVHEMVFKSRGHDCSLDFHSNTDKEEEVSSLFAPLTMLVLHEPTATRRRISAADHDPIAWSQEL